MTFKIDENLPAQLANDLRVQGHEAETVVDEGMVGSPDGILLLRAQSEGRVFITMDKGIANIQKYPPSQYPGLILLRPRLTGRQAVRDFARMHLPNILRYPLAGRLVVLTDAGARIR